MIARALAAVVTTLLVLPVMPGGGGAQTAGRLPRLAFVDLRDSDTASHIIRGLRDGLNARVARTLGLTLPASVLLRATRVID